VRIRIATEQARCGQRRTHLTNGAAGGAAPGREVPVVVPIGAAQLRSRLRALAR
jgi:hypothetical protein